ncbi:MAG: NAD-dependent epimerase/dehydratase family protein [Puniceicoccales bacterium]|jgi:UDP-glucose 4-epimerase|nr:NAD-dependent epimerase/dehydratase family protein [Puniceicoccales bacterium]
MPNVLVTGGCGYVGSGVIHRLKRLGYGVSVLDSLVCGDKRTIPEDVPLYVGDYSNLALVEQILSKQVVDCVLHCGAWTDVRESLVEPMRYFINNLAGTMFLLQAMVHCHVKQIVYLSTASVYGEVESGLANELQVPNPINPDGMTHLGVEQLLASLAESERWSVVILRPSNVVGRVSPGGSTFWKKNTLFSVLGEVVGGERESCEVFGCDRPTFDGTAVRDYVHGEDVVRALVSALSSLPAMGTGVTYNLASGRGNSVLEVIRGFEKVSGKSIPVVESAAHPGEIARSVLEPRKAQRELHWGRRFDDLESLIRDVCLGKEQGLFG